MLRASVAIALVLRQEVIEVELPEGSTVSDALADRPPLRRIRVAWVFGPYPAHPVELRRV